MASSMASSIMASVSNMSEQATASAAAAAATLPSTMKDKNMEECVRKYFVEFESKMISKLQSLVSRGIIKCEAKMSDEKVVEAIKDHHPIWDLICCLILLNLQFIRTDRHGSPAMVLESLPTLSSSASGKKDNEEGKEEEEEAEEYILVLYLPLVKIYLANLIPRLNLTSKKRPDAKSKALPPKLTSELTSAVAQGQAKNRGGAKPLFPNIGNLYAKFHTELSSTGFFAQAKHLINKDQYDKMMLFWGAAESRAAGQKAQKVHQFRKKLLAIQGKHLEMWLNRAAQHPLLQEVRKGWNRIPHREKASAFQISSEAVSSFNVIENPEMIPTRIGFLVSEDEKSVLLANVFSGLDTLLCSPTLKRLYGDVSSLNWQEKPLSVGWTEAGSKFPSWKEVIHEENPFYSKPLEDMSDFCGTLWWENVPLSNAPHHPKSPVEDKPKKRKAPSVSRQAKTKKVKQESISVSISPSMLPSLLSFPTNQAVPSAMPSAIPSVPAAIPSAIPSVPTAIPSVIPSAMPSAMPSVKQEQHSTPHPLQPMTLEQHYLFQQQQQHPSSLPSLPKVQHGDDAESDSSGTEDDNDDGGSGSGSDSED